MLLVKRLDDRIRTHRAAGVLERVALEMRLREVHPDGHRRQEIANRVQHADPIQFGVQCRLPQTRTVLKTQCNQRIDRKWRRAIDRWKGGSREQCAGPQHCRQEQSKLHVTSQVQCIDS